MKIFNVKNPGEFLERVQRCRGRVYSVDADGRKRDLKQQAEYLKSSGMLRYVGQIDQMEIVLEDSADITILLHYMSEMACDPSRRRRSRASA